MLDVTLNARGQIVGSQYQELATVIGCLVKVGTNFPITKTWNQIEERNKESAWKEVERNTFLPEEAKSLVYEMLNSTFKEWKYLIKNHFKKFEPNDDNDKEVIKQLDNRVIESQFREAIQHWRKPEVQEQAHTNATNRGQRKFPHKTGRTSFLKVANELSSNGVSAMQLGLKLDQINELIAMYGPPQASSRIASCSANNVSQVPDSASIGRQVHHILTHTIHASNKDGVKVSLFGDGIPKELVGEGILVSKDPKEKVSNLPLGPDHWKIYLETAICPSYVLSGFGEATFTIAQAINTFLAWPKENVLES